MYMDDVIHRISENISFTKTYDYEDMLFQYTANAYYVLTDSSRENKTRHALCVEIYNWYVATYMFGENAVGDGTGVFSPSRNAGNLCELNQNVRQIVRSDIGKEEQNQYMEAFDKNYSFSSINRKTFLDLLEDSRKRPRLIDILRIAVGFKLTEQVCNHLLYTYGYMKLHAKNPFHIAVYVVLKEMEKQSEAERSGKYDQFKRVHDILFETLWMMNTPDGVDERKQNGGVKKHPGNSTTYIYNSVLTMLDYRNCAKYIAEHKEVFNERHRKLLEEYRRLESIFRPLFFDGGKQDNPDMVKVLWSNCGTEYFRTISEPHNYPFYSLYRFISDFCCPLTPTHIQRDMHTTIFLNNRVHKPTREIMIILWIFEYCYANAACIPCTEEIAVLYLRRYAELMTDQSVKSLTPSVLRKLINSGEKTEEEKKKMSKHEMLQEIGVYIDRNMSPKAFLNISKLLGIINPDLQRHGFRSGTEPAEENNSALFWRGSDLRSILDLKLSQFGMLPISNNNRFDNTITELCKITYKNENGSGAYYYDNQKIFGIVPGEAAYYRTTDQPQPVDFLPERLRLLFRIVEEVSGRCGNPLDCRIYEI